MLAAHKVASRLHPVPEWEKPEQQGRQHTFSAEWHQTEVLITKLESTEFVNEGARRLLGGRRGQRHSDCGPDGIPGDEDGDGPVPAQPACGKQAPAA